MKVAKNRWVSFYYLVLAAIPISMLAILVGADGGSAWQAPYAIFVLNPVVLSTLGLATLALSALSFPNRARSAAFYLYLLGASLALVAIWAFLMPGLVMVLYAIPSWFLWRLYRQSNVIRRAA